MDMQTGADSAPSIMRDVTITISGPQGSGKSLLHEVVRRALSAVGVQVDPDPVEGDGVGLHGVDLGEFSVALRVEQEAPTPQPFSIADGKVHAHTIIADRIAADDRRFAMLAAGAASTLSLDDYQERAGATAIYPGKGTPLGLIYCGLKLTGEAGEVSEKIGKAIRDDGLVAPENDEFGFLSFANLTPERREAIKAELGDVLWYVARAAAELGSSLSEIGQGNLDKLAGRAARGTLQGSGDNR